MKPAARRWAGRSAGLLAWALLVFSDQAQSQEKVDLELVIAVDVSGSVDSEEYTLQMGGIAAAFREPQMFDAIRASTPNGIAVTVVLWSSSDEQNAVVGWRRVANPDQAVDFAAAVDGARRSSSGNTAIGSAISHATGLFLGNGFDGSRRVIDVSGDGISNDGPDIAPARDRALARGITINGLVIVEGNLVANRFYREQVVGGVGAFVVSARGFADFAEAFLRKLLREIRGPAIS